VADALAWLARVPPTSWAVLVLSVVLTWWIAAVIDEAD
jgi:hypothetical protein